jgi:GPH family glycoside/pentoside/hexuronide:cation symporter
MSKAPNRAGGVVLSLPAVLAFASASIPIAALQLAVAVHLPRYFASTVGLSLVLVGSAFALVRFVDIPIDALIGVAMDRTRTRLGRYRVWMVLGAPILMGGLYMLLSTPSGAGQGYLMGWLLVMYIGYSMVYLAHLAWGATLSPTYQQRSRIFGAITGLGVVGALAVLLIPVVMQRLHHTDGEGVRAMMWFLIGAVPVTLLLALSRTAERVARPPSTKFALRDYGALLRRGNVIRVLVADFCALLGPGWMAALYLFYFKDSRGFDTASANLLLMIYIGAGFVGAPFTAWMANRISKHRAFMVNTTIYSLGLIILPFLPAGNFLAFVPGMFLVGAMAAGFVVMIRAITGDIADEIRLESGREWMGLMYALTNGTTKLAAAGSIFLTFNVLAAIGYQAKERAVNTPEAIRGLELAYIIGPIVFVMIAGACFIGYRLTAERHSEIRRLLDEGDALYGDAPILEPLAGEGAVAQAVAARSAPAR